ncbi:MAG: tetratricopeptide repeat protein [Flavobacteriales bacterium]|jgi:tetratricopeptide (TPR) repeat protein|nr:tetratricopeptide repeat protein [Flavobacteriales bacterium]MCB0757670.1 tetratricopeptide repeat protein [Flavobacteriales bacterium]
MPDRNADQEHCVQRYEAMESTRDRLFFDVEELEMIIDHYLERNEPRRAEKVLAFAKQLHPASMDITLCEAVVMMALGRLSKALELLDAIEKVEPYNEEVQLHKAGIYSQQRNHRRSVEHYKRALDLAEEGLDDIYLDLAFEHENLEEFDDAIGCLKNALELNPENEAVLYELAYCYDLAGADEACITFFRNFTNEQPYSSVSWFNLGNVFAKLERYEESNQALDLAIAIDERFSSAYFSKARNLLIASRFEEAIACYEETLVFDGPQAITYSFIGECYEKMERFEQALISYDQSIALDPEWVDAWIGRGVVMDMQDRVQEAVLALQHAVRISSDNTDALYYYAAVLARAERYAEAFATYEKLNLMEPQNLDGWLDHADLLLKLKGADAALAKFHEGAQVHKFNVRFRYRMVSYLLQAGREQQGLLELEEALMADHAAHVQLLEHWPEATKLPQITHLLELYRR